jgi:hypothetical protein
MELGDCAVDQSALALIQSCNSQLVAGRQRLFQQMILLLLLIAGGLY